MLESSNISYSTYWQRAKITKQTMNKSTFLQSLPFLQLIPPSTPTKIWKSHRDKIIEYIQSAEERRNKNGGNGFKKNNSIKNEEVCCLFSLCSHVVSIEPNIHHSGQVGKPAFFVRPNDSNEKNHYDPALTGFSAFLLPAEISGGEHPPLSPLHSPTNHTKQQQTSPTFSTASTSMSVTPQYNQQQHPSATGGKFENSNSSNSLGCGNNGDIDGRKNEMSPSTLFKTHVLYFLFQRDDNNENHIIQSSSSSDESFHNNTKKITNEKTKKRQGFDLYFVDMHRIHELQMVTSPSTLSMSQNEKNPDKSYYHQHNEEEIEIPKNDNSTKMMTMRDQNKLIRKPASLLIKFGSCNFRIFDRDFLERCPHQIESTESNEDTTTSYEEQLRYSLERIKDCIISQHEKTQHFTCFNNSTFSPSLGTPQVSSKLSIYPYLFRMFYPSTRRDRQHEHGCMHKDRQEVSATIDENGQIEKVPTTTDEDTQSNSNSNPNSSTTTSNHTGEDRDRNDHTKGFIETPGSLRENEKRKQKDNNIGEDGKEVVKENLKGTSATPMKIFHGRKRKYKSYEKSWSSLEKIHKIMNSSTNLTNHQQFASLLQISATELRDSYIIDEVVPRNECNDTSNSTNIFVSREAERRELECKISNLENSIDESIQRIFPSSSTGGRSSLKKKDKTAIVTEERIIESNLKKYRKAIAAQHMMSFLPSR